MSGLRRCAYGFLCAFCRSFAATIAPMWIGRAGAADVGADVRGEVAAGARVHRHDERHRHRQRPHRVGLRLLLERDRQHALVHAGLHQRRGHDARSSRRPSRPCAPAAAACRRRRARRPGTARASSRPRTGPAPCRPRPRRCRRSRQVGVVERAVDRLAAQPRHRHVLALGPVVGLTDPDHGGELLRPSQRRLHHAHEVLLQGRPATWRGRAPCRRCRPRSAGPPRRCGSARR